MYKSRKFGIGSSLTAMALALAAVPVAAEGSVEGWSLAETDVEPDPSITYGVLPNGMRYAIQSNDKPENAVSIRMHVNFGSIQEDEEERGLAHFIEHMAFNGSTNVAEGEMIRILEKEGLAFGPDTNAYTSFDETVYMLDVPSVTSERLNTALFLMREIAGEISFAPEAVERERGVILSERRSRDTVDLRSIEDQFEFFIPDTLYPDRLPIGTAKVLTTASPDQMRSLYQRYYRPENVTLIIVGDIDTEKGEALIKQYFSDWKAAKPEAAVDAVSYGSVDFSRGKQLDTFVDPAAIEEVQIRFMELYRDPPDTLENRRKLMARNLVVSLFDRRIQDIASRAGTPILGGGLALADFDEVAESTLAIVQTKDGAWKDGLTTLENELRRAALYGFTEREIARELADHERNYRIQVEQAEARKNAALAAGLVNVASENDFVTTPQFKYDLFKDFAAKVTPESVAKTFRDMLDGSGPLIRVASKTDVNNTQIAEAFQMAAATEVVAIEEGAELAFGYENFGEPGAIVSDELLPELGIRRITFDNNVRLNLKTTDFEPGRILYSIDMSGGAFALPESIPDQGAAIFLQLTSPIGATSKHSSEDLQELTAGKAINLGISAELDEFVAQGATTPADFPLQMKIATAYLTDPGFRQEAQDRWSNIIPAIFARINSMPTQVAAIKGLAQLVPEDDRIALPDENALLSIQQSELSGAYKQNAKSGAIEIGVVGDFDATSVIETISRTFGALPQREASAPSYADQRIIRPTQDRSTVTLQHSGQADQAYVVSYWPTTDDSDFQTEVGMELLESVVNVMLTDSLREELGAAYGASVESQMSDDLKDFGIFSAGALVSPQDIEGAEEAIGDVIDRISTGDFSDEIITRAKNPLLEQHNQALTTNGFWLGWVRDAQSESERLERIKAWTDLLKSIGRDELMRLATEYLQAEQRLKVRVVSDMPGAPVE